MTTSTIANRLDAIRRDPIEGPTTTWPSGASPSAVADAARSSGIRFDDELASLYGAMNGSGGNVLFLVETDEVVGCRLLSLSEALAGRPTSTMKAPRAPFFFRAKRVAPDPRIQLAFRHPKWLPIADNGSTVVYYDDAPTAAGQHGQVIAFQHDPDAMYWIANSIGELLDASSARTDDYRRQLRGEPPAAVEHRGPSRRDSCSCARHRSTPLTFDALEELEFHGGAIRQSLERLAVHEPLNVALYRCCVCGMLWQGRALAGRGLFELQPVPPSDVAQWLEMPFQDLREVMIYRKARADLLSRLAPGTSRCRAAGCMRTAVRFGVECVEHTVEYEESRGALKVPRGRPW